MKNLDKKVEALYAEIMKQCKDQRKSKLQKSIKALASELELSESFVSSFEGGRAFPSTKTFLKYLILNGFDLTPLKNLKIYKNEKPIDDLRSEHIREIKKMDEKTLRYLTEVVNIIRAQGF